MFKNHCKSLHWKCSDKLVFWVKVEFFDCNSLTIMSLFKSDYLNCHYYSYLNVQNALMKTFGTTNKQLKTDNFTIVLTVRAHMTIEQPSKAKGGFSLWKTPSALKPQHNTTSANAFWGFQMEITVCYFFDLFSISLPLPKMFLGI